MANEVNEGYGERIRALRKALNKTQIEFAELIKTTNGHISDMEKERKNLSERSIKIICDEFNVNEEWLRTGNGEMFIVTNNTVISQLKEMGYDTITIKIMETYLSLPQDYKNIINGVIEKFTEALNTKSKQAELAEELTPSTYIEMEIIEPDKWEAETDRVQAILDAQKTHDIEYNKDAKKGKISS